MANKNETATAKRLDKEYRNAVARKKQHAAKAAPKTDAEKQYPGIKDKPVALVPPAQRDKIQSVSAASGGGDTMFVTNMAGASTKFHRNQYTKEAQDISRKGMSYSAFVKWLAANPPKARPAKLARGLDGHNAPHSAKAAADSRKEPKANSVKTKAEKREVAKVAKQAKPTKTTHDAKLTVLVQPKDSGLKVDSDRYARLAAIVKCKTVGEALAKTIAGGKKIGMDNLKGMVKRNHIKIG